MRNFIFFIIILYNVSNFAQETTSTRKDSGIPSPTGISVTIGGSFVVTGSFLAGPLERIDHFITRIFNQGKAQILGNNFDEKLNLKLENFALRNIKLKRNSGQEMTIDLLKFRQTADFSYNPYLKNDDVLIFPKLDLEREFIAIDGAVNNPVKFQYVKGDCLADAILFAQGISGVYENVKTAEITRLNYAGDKEEIININIDSNFLLNVGDRIRILADESNRKDYRVLVLGEVLKPGYISIAKDNVFINDVIKKAGGFKSEADLSNAELIRGTDSYTYYKKEMLTKSFELNKFSNDRIENPLYDYMTLDELEMMRMSYLKDEDSVYFKIDDQLRMLRGNAIIDFSQINSDTSIVAKFKVKDGDVILIPSKKDLVYVFGQVVNAGYIKYEEGKDVNYYINASGGLGELAKDIEEISIIKSKARTWTVLGEKNIKIEPGDFIWVPKKTPHDFSYYFDFYGRRIGEVASIIGTIVTIILLTKK